MYREYLSYFLSFCMVNITTLTNDSFASSSCRCTGTAKVVSVHDEGSRGVEFIENSVKCEGYGLCPSFNQKLHLVPSETQPEEYDHSEWTIKGTKSLKKLQSASAGVRFSFSYSSFDSIGPCLNGIYDYGVLNTVSGHEFTVGAIEEKS